MFGKPFLSTGYMRYVFKFICLFFLLVLMLQRSPNHKLICFGIPCSNLTSRLDNYI